MWQQLEARRQLLIDLATSKGFDPFDPQTWYSFKRADIAKLVVFVLYFFFLF
jgi:hypothetical protein